MTQVTVEGELRTLNHDWGTIQKLAQTRQEWRSFVAALHASRHSRQQVVVVPIIYQVLLVVSSCVC